MPYRKDGNGTLWVPNKEDEPEKAEKLIESLKQTVKRDNYEEQWIGGYDKGDFILEELYIDTTGNEKSLDISGKIDEVFVDLSIPLENNKRLQKISEKLAEITKIDEEDSGLYLKKDDFKEVRTKTADGQGRINLGKDYSGEDVRVVIVD